MKEIVYPVLLSALVVPGAGQLYNKEKAKGIVLITLFFLVMLGFTSALSVMLAQQLPVGTVTLPPDQLKELASDLLQDHGGFISTFWYLVLAIWGYGILDAFLGARDLAKMRRAPPTPPTAS